MRSISRSILTAALFASAGMPLASTRAQAQVPGTRPVVVIPRLDFGGGVLRYRETDFDTAPGTESDFDEPVFETGIEWDVVFGGHHALNIELGFWQTSTGTEDWEENGTPIQMNDLDVGRFSLAMGYLASTWDRSAPPQSLAGPARWIRFAGGLRAYYRHQAFERDDFTVFLPPPPTFSSRAVEETFDMAGGEVALDLEFGPRDIVSGFIRGFAGGGYVGVLNDGLGPVVDKEDMRIDTAGVHGTIEVGILSQFIPQLELRLGYRYHRMEVFQDRRTVSAVDPFLGPVVFSVELPDNTTELHVAFFEAAFPF